MPFLSRLYVKTALVYLVLALALGVLSASGTMAGITARLWPSFVHLLVLGWLTQLIFGVAYWLFPRFERESPYGPSWYLIAAYPLLNVGLVLRVVAEAGTGGLPDGVRTALLISAAFGQWVAVVLLSVYTWGRVRAK